MEESIKDYLMEILPAKEGWIRDLEVAAKKDHVPIMDPIGIHFIMQLIRIHQPKQILEVGTAIGYSALRMLEAYPETMITTIEKDEERYYQAIQNIERQGKQEKIHVINGDALDEMEKLYQLGKSFDFIFIDAAKGQYKKFFDLSVPILNDSGLVVTDNVLFRGYVANPVDSPKKFKNMVEKIRGYNKFLMEHPLFDTSIIPIGDGVAVSYKK
ncbi:O-methyltransferase [Oceanobacillus piezotolerans]|uniref:tRNA 5-hydroxyuridine methyltransferase n=1 Tax=Oceanobacillus piezotolerans TaxID=2448030 RepID=A0A498DFN9_9BACI|nr:O-methyltransferase [Oceanobacillus piezotolerans]RLL48008.1 O-methyltransferase [Oceanobacillus piezotolerans]